MAADLDKKLLQVSKFIQKGQLERAVKEYQKLATLHKRDPKILNSLGDTYIKLKQIDNALEVFNDVADRYIKEGFLPNAIAIYRKMLRFKPDEIDVKLKLADLYVKVGMFSDAEFYYNQFADHFVHRGEIIKAIPAFEKICSINPENIELRKTLAGLYFRVENIDKMFAMYKEVFDYLMAKKDNDGLADVFNTVTAISNKNNLLTNPTYFTIFEEYITYLFRMNEGSLAKKSAMDMAGIYLELGNPRWAQALYNKVLELDPGEMSARIKLIELYKKQGESSLLIQEYLNMAEYLKESDPARANVIYAEVLQLDPENIEARTALHGEAKTPPSEKEAPPARPPAEKEEAAPSMVESPDVESHVYGEEEAADDINISLGDVEVSTGEDFKDKLKSVDLSAEEEEPEISVEIEGEEPEEAPREAGAAPEMTEEAEAAPAVSEKKGFFDDDEEMNIEFEVEVGAGGNMEVKEKPAQKENLETALADIFSQYSEKLGDQQSLLSNINDLDSEEFIPSVDEIVNTFKKGLEEQLGGDPQAHYDMGIAYKEMGLYDSAIGEFRKLSLLPQYRFKSLNLLAQTLVEKGDYQEAVEEFLEVLEDEDLTEEERDGVLYNIVVAYFRAERYTEAFDYYNRISSHQIFKKDELFNEIRKKLHALFPDDIRDEEAQASAGGVDWGDEAPLSIEHEESPFADVTVDEEESTEKAPAPAEEYTSEPPSPEGMEHLLSEIEELKDSVATNEDLIKDNSELITLLLQSREETQQLKNGWEALEERIRTLETLDERLKAMEKRMDDLEQSHTGETGEGEDAITLEEKRLLVKDLKNFKEEIMNPDFHDAMDFIRTLSREGEPGLLHRIMDETASLQESLTETPPEKQKKHKKETPPEEAPELLPPPEDGEELPGTGDLLEPPPGEEGPDDEEQDDDDKISYF